MATTREDIREWMMAFSSRHCLNCADNCCDGTRQLINMDKDEERSIDLFRKRGIPVYRFEELDERSVVRWLALGMYRGLGNINGAHFIGDILTKDGIVLKKPALIETPKIRGVDLNFTIVEETMFVLYVEKYCPFFSQTSGCEVYGNPDRPDGCKSYPLYAFEAEGGLRAEVQRTCPRANEVYGELRERFPDVRLELL